MKREQAFTLIELLMVVALIAIIAAICIPSLLNAKKTANEASAVNSLRTLTTISQTYRTRFQAYASNLAALETAGYLDNVLGSGVKSGYMFSYAGAANTWTCSADPIVKGSTGDRFFFVDESGVIRFNSSATATAASSAID